MRLRDCLEWLFWLAVAWLVVQILRLGMATRKSGWQQ